MAQHSNDLSAFQMPVSAQIWDSKYRYRLNNQVVDTHVTDTYWYLSGVPELLAVTSRRFEHFAQAGWEKVQ